MIKPVVIHMQHIECLIGNRRIHPACPSHLGKVAHPAQQPVSDTRRSPRATSDLACTLTVCLNVQQACRACHDLGQLLNGIEFKPLHDTETVTQR